MVRPLVVLHSVPASPLRPERRPMARRLLRAVGTLCWGVPLAALLVVAIALVVAKLHGYTPIAVRSASMEPTIRTYALAFMEHVPPTAIKRGDIITFDPPGPHERVTHRVVRRYEHGNKLMFETRGDANPSTDDWRSAEQAEAKRIDADGGDVGGYSIRRQERGVTYGTADAIRYAFHVPWLGYAAVFLERPIVRRYGLYVPFALLSIWALSLIWLRPMGTPDDEAAPVAPKTATAWRDPQRTAHEDATEDRADELDGDRRAA